MEEDDEQSWCVQGIPKRKDVNVRALVGLHGEDSRGWVWGLHTLGAWHHCIYSSDVACAVSTGIQLTDWPLRKNEHSQKRDGLSRICSLPTFWTFRWDIPLHPESPLIFLEAFAHAFSSERHTNASNMFHLRNHGSSSCNYLTLITSR